jgi:hypothetical protein
MRRKPEIKEHGVDPHPNPLPREREQNRIPLLPREKGLGDEGVQSL